MTKKILVTAVLVGTLATSAFAYNKDCQNSGQRGVKNGQANQQGMMRKSHKMNKKGMSRRGGMQMFSQLNLSDDQRYQLSILRDEMKLEIKKARGVRKQGQMMNFLNDSGFDKDAFKKDINARQQKMLDLKAIHMEKVFKILTKEQIVELKKKLNS